MSLPHFVAEVLKDHVTLEVEGIDRMYLNVYQPRLQTDRGVAAFFRFHRGETFASSALMPRISRTVGSIQIGYSGSWGQFPYKVSKMAISEYNYGFSPEGRVIASGTGSFSFPKGDPVVSGNGTVPFTITLSSEFRRSHPAP
jgi:hypothetical protein